MNQRWLYVLIILLWCSGCGAQKPAQTPTAPATAQDAALPTFALSARVAPSPSPSPTRTRPSPTPIDRPDMLVAPITSVSFVDTLHGWMARDNLVLATTDGGLHWSSVYTATTNTPIILSFTTAQDGWASIDGQLQTTSDSGVSWQLAAAPPGNVRYVRFGNDRIGVIYMNGIPFLTRDAGSTWLQLVKPCGTDSPSGAPEARPSGQLWMICPLLGYPGWRPNRLYTSVDMGRTWQLVCDFTLEGKDQLPSNGHARDLSFADAMHGWVITRNYLYYNGDGHYGYLSRSVDGGKTWSVLEHTPPGEYLSIAFPSPDWGYLVAHTTDETTLYRTEDGGATWHALYRAPPGKPEHPPDSN